MGKGKKKKGGKRMNKKQLSEKLQQFFEANPEKTYKLKEIFSRLTLNTHPLKMLAMDILEDMAWDDYLKKVDETSYSLNREGQVLEGRFVRKPNGKNSIVPDGSDQGIFVAERNSMFAVDGDKVRVQLLARRQNHIKEAMVIEILEHAKDTLVGTLVVRKDLAFLHTPNNIFSTDVIIPKRSLKGGKHNDNAIVQIVVWPSNEAKNPIGKVIDVLGPSGNNDAEMNSILAKYQLPYNYPKRVEEAAEKISAEITAEDLAEREDFRDVFTCTIDPKDAKDFDDALSIQQLPNGQWQVGVHIADVSHYVKEGSIIDKEAFKRATSVYLVDRTIPMLPERLCNFICSLRPNEEKLAYSVIFNMDEEAHVKSYRIVHTVIKSNRRFIYEEVQQTLEENGVKDGTGRPAPRMPVPYIGEYADQLIMLDRLAKRLRERRFRNGSVNFDSEELHFDVDKEGKPTRCYVKRSKDANKLVEEFMVLANKTVAESIGKVSKRNGKKTHKPKTLPYRIHDNPDPQKLEALHGIISKFGYKLKTAGTKGQTARSLNKLMEDIKDHREEKLIEALTLRSMMKAKYSVHNIGHFGLAFDYYTHFTSPIRRYPDTMVHRLLTKYADGGRSANAKHYEELCQHCNDMEVVAQTAERESIKYKMVEFMGEKLGEEFTAHISGITSYGIYCEIDKNHCEGMVALHDLDDDYYFFDEKNYCLVGRRHHYKYQLGDKVTIKVAAANLEKRQLDFVLIGSERDTRRGSRKSLEKLGLLPDEDKAEEEATDNSKKKKKAKGKKTKEKKEKKDKKKSKKKA
jgi:ribonuclease R